MERNGRIFRASNYLPSLLMQDHAIILLEREHWGNSPINERPKGHKEQLFMLSACFFNIVYESSELATKQVLFTNP